MAGLVATVLIFFLLRVSLDSWRLAYPVLLSLPVALVGGILDRALRGATANPLAGIAGGVLGPSWEWPRAWHHADQPLPAILRNMKVNRSVRA